MRFHRFHWTVPVVNGFKNQNLLLMIILLMFLSNYIYSINPFGSILAVD